MPSDSNDKGPARRMDDDPDDDDLDDLDASFNAKPKHKTTQPDPKPSAISLNPNASKGQEASDNDIVDDDFDDSLTKEMEALLRNLALEHPPGPMPDNENDQVNSKTEGLSRSKPELSEEEKKLKQEEEDAWKIAVEMMLSGQGLEALGLAGNKDADAKSGENTGLSNEPRSSGSKGLTSNPASKSTSTSTTTKPTAGGSGTRPNEGANSFEETIRRTMASLDTAGKKHSNKSPGGEEDDIAALLAKLQNDPSFLDNMGGLEGLDKDDDLGGLLDGMMSQLMTKEVLEEPMAELASKYPAYLASPPSQTSQNDIEKYKQQHRLVEQILSTFRKPGYTDEKDGKEIARLVGEMQDLGGPPEEIMGDLPPGFDLGALGNNDDACCIM